MEVLKTVAEVVAWRARRGGRGCVLVPTMGALHAGHAALVKQGAGLARDERLAAGCIVSVFVNPTQFNEKADYERYPKTLGDDVALCADAGASAVWAPGPEDVYPAGGGVDVPRLPAVATRPGLEDAKRPGHFAGVCQVVKRLLEVVEPAASVFGEKDWQQLQVVTAMVGELGLAGRIVPGPTVREADGLAMSSRNRFLTGEDRRRASAISRALLAANYTDRPGDAEAVMREVLGEEGIEPEYAVVRDAASLEAPGPQGPWRALIAARLGAVRLIDNAAWGVESAAGSRG